LKIGDLPPNFVAIAKGAGRERMAARNDRGSIEVVESNVE